MGVNERKRTLIPIFEEHNDRMKALIGKEFAKGTYTRYKTCLSHTKEFLHWKYNVSDIEIEEIDHAFIADFEFYLRTEKACANNSAVKYIKNFGKIIRICLANKWLKYDPFISYNSKFIVVDRSFLDEDEIQKLSEKHLEIETPSHHQQKLQRTPLTSTSTLTFALTSTSTTTYELSYTTHRNPL